MRNFFYTRRFLVSLWLALYLYTSLLYTPVIGGEIEVDATAPDNQQPGIEIVSHTQTDAQIPVINITQPEGGVSHNTFTEYHVAEQGVIFNNNSDVPIDDADLNSNKSCLTGAPLHINDNLHGMAAEVILTEVTGTHVSNLLGPTEIYGHRADFILANPNGIYCNGANFINANRVTLTTGKPEFDPQNVLQQLSVKKGTIQVVGNGIQSREFVDTQIPTSPIELLSKVIEISGTLQHVSSDVYLYGGEQDFKYKNRHFIPQQSAQSKPTNKYVAVDANLLGNIQANKIYIIATQQGVGVNSPKLSAKEEIEITAAGDIRLKEVHTGKDLLVASYKGSILQEGTKTVVARDYELEAAQGNITINTPELQIGGKGKLTSKQLTITHPTKVWAEGEASKHPTFVLQVSEKLNNQGNISVSHLAASPLEELVNTGNIITQKSLGLVSQQIYHTGKIVARKGDIQLIGSDQIINQGLILSQQGELNLQGGSIYNTGKISTKQQLSLSATNLEQKGTIEGKGVKLSVQGVLKNQKDIYSQGELAISSGQLHNTGEIKAGKQLKLTASSLEQQGKIYGKGVELTIHENLKNQQEIFAQEELTIISNQIHNTGELKAGKQLSLKATSLEQAGLVKGKGAKLSVHGALNNTKEIVSLDELAIASRQFNNHGKVVAVNHLNIDGKNLYNEGVLHTQQGNIILQIQDNFTNTKEISSKLASVTLKTPAHINNQGTLQAHQDLVIEAGDLDNYHHIQAIHGKISMKLAQRLINQPAAELSSPQEMDIQAAEMLNHGNIVSKGVINLTANKLLNKKEGRIEAAVWKSMPFEQVLNEGSLTIIQDIDLITDNLNNTGTLISQQGGIKLEAKQDLVNQKEIISQRQQTLQVRGSLANSGILSSQQGGMTIRVSKELVNEKNINSQGVQNIQVAGKLTNQGTILANKDQAITANQLENTGTILSQEGISTLEAAQELNNVGNIRSHQAQKIQAGTLTNRGEIASEIGSLTITVQQDLLNEAILHTSTNLDIQAKALTNKHKIYAGGLSTITLTEQLTNKADLVVPQGLTLEVGSVTNSGSIQSQEGQITLIAHQHLANKNLIVSKKDLILQTPLLLNQASGKIYTNQLLHLNNLRQLTNAGAITAISIQQVGMPILNNNGRLQVTKELNMALDDLQSTGTIQADRGGITIQSNRNINHLKGALLHAQQRMSLTAGEGITNAGALQAEKGTLAMTAAKLTNEGQLLAPSLLLIATQGPLLNYQTISSQTENIILKTLGQLINQGTVQAHQDLLVEAKEIDNKNLMQATNGKAIIKLANKLDNQLTARLVSAQDMSIQAIEINNQGNIISSTGLDLSVSNLLNLQEGLIQASHWSSQPFQQITNAGEITIFRDIDLVTDKLNNTGKLITQHGGICLYVNEDLENEQEITSHGAQNLIVRGNMTNKGTLKAEKLDVHVHQDLINEKDILSTQVTNLEVAGKLRNSGQIQADQHQSIQARSIENQGNIHSGLLTMGAKEHTFNTGSIQGGKGVELRSQTLTNAHTGLIKSQANSRLTTKGVLENQGQIESKQDVDLVSSAGNIDNAGTIHAGQEAQLTAQDGITNGGVVTGSNLIAKTLSGHFKNEGTFKGKNLIVDADKVTNNGVLQPIEGLTIQAKDILNNKEISASAATLKLTATNKLTNNQPIKSKTSNIQLASGQLDNHSEIASGGQLTITTPQLTNQEGAALVSHQALILQDIDQLNNAGQIYAYQLVHTGVPIFINQSKGSIQTGTTCTLNTQSFTNQGAIRVATGDLIIQSKKDIIQGQGKIITQAGNITLQAPAGNVINQGEITSNNSIQIEAGKELQNAAFLGAKQDVEIQAQTLSNTGEIKATGTTTFMVQTKLHNKNKVTTGGNLLVNRRPSSLELINEGMIASGSTLNIYARTLTNQASGALQAKVSKLEITDSVLNAKDIQAAETLTITTGKLNNSGEISANQALEITAQQSDIENSGTLASSHNKVKLAIQQGSLHNTNQIISNEDLEIRVGKLLNNQGKVIAGKLLTIIASSANNSGTISGKGGACLTTTTSDLTNNGLLGSWGSLILTVAKKLDNQKKGKISTIEGSLTLIAQDINNTGAINPGKAASTITSKEGIFYHHGAIQARGALTIKADKRIENRGEVLVQQDLLLEAPIIQHYHQLQSNQGNLTLKASQQIENSGKLVSFKQLLLDTPKLSNHANLGSDKDLTLHIPEIENTKRIFAGGRLYIRATTLTNHGEMAIVNVKNAKQEPTNRKLDLHATTFTNWGEILGGEGDNLLEVAKLLTNYNKIATAGPLTIEAPAKEPGNLEVVNHGELTANGSLNIQAKKLTSSRKLQGAGKSHIKVDEVIHNQGTIASVEDLSIQADELSTTTDEAATIQSNQNLIIQVGKLNNHNIQGGKGETTIAITQLDRWEQENVISSVGNLVLNLLEDQVLSNRSQIIAGGELIINGGRGSEIKNRPEAHIQGSTVKIKLSPTENSYGYEVIDNKGKMIGLEKLALVLPHGYIHNSGQLQAGRLLHVGAREYTNYEGSATLAGGDAHIQADYIKNYRGQIFTGGNMTLEGQDGDYAAEITNKTGSIEARMEAMGDITIKAKKLENIGEAISWDYNIETQYPNNNVGAYASNDWIEVSTSYGRYPWNSNEQHGNTSYDFYEKERRVPISKTRTRLAHINARGSLTLIGISEINNYGSELAAGNKLVIKHTNGSSSSFQEPLKNSVNTVEGASIKNVTPSKSINLSDAHVYEKDWEFLGFNLWRKYHKSQGFTIESTDKATIRGGSETAIEAQELYNGIQVPTSKIAPCADPLAQVEGNGLVKMDDFKLPEGEHGLFTVQIDATVAVDNNQVTPPTIKTSQVELPTWVPSEFTPIDIQIDPTLANELAPAHYTPADIQQAIAPEVPEAIPHKLAALPVPSTDSHFQTIQHQKPRLAGAIETNHELPTGATYQEESRELAADYIAYEPAPPIEEVKFTCLPPLVRSAVPVDQSKFYGSPYFLRHVGLDPGQRGTPANPLRFLGDPFYESRIISDAIQKATARQLLYQDVATPEEQIKVLMDNTAAVTKDLQVSLGVALTKEQINSLKKDIIWYEEKEVGVGAGKPKQKVLVPQVYLTKDTITNLRSNPSGGILSGGKMTLNIQDKLTNTGNISSRGDMDIQAGRIQHQSVGPDKASIQSGGKLNMKATHDILVQGAKVSATGDALIKSEKGDVSFLTQEIKEGKNVHHTVSELATDGNLKVEAKNITFKATDLEVKKDATFQAEGNFSALAAQDIEETTTYSHEHQEDNGLFTSKSTTKTTKTTHRAVTSKGPNFKIGGTLSMNAGGNADFEGAHVAAENVQLKAEGATTIRNAYDETTQEVHSSQEKKDEALFGLFKNNSGKNVHSKAFDKQATGNVWNIKNKMEVTSKGDLTTQGIHLTAHEFKLESTQGNVYDKAAEEAHESYVDERKYEEKQGLLGFKTQKEQGRIGLKLREKQEKNSTTKDNKHTAKSSSFKTTGGNGTLKGAKKVILEATETDIQGKLSLQGKEGVSILAKKETEEQKTHIETHTEELSFGVKNHIVAAVYQGKAVLDAIKAEEAALKNYSNYKGQLQAAKALYERGEITQEEYGTVQEEEKFHLMATAAAALAIGSKTKQFLSTTASAIKTAGPTLGFSIDLQGDIRKTVDDVMQLHEKAKGSKIKTHELEVITGGTFQVEASQIASQASTIQAKKLEVKSLAGKQHSQSNGNSTGGNVTVGMDVLPAVDASLDIENRKGRDQGIQHTHSLLNLGHATLNIEKDVHIKGGLVTTKTLEGKIGGDVKVETVLDTHQGGHTTIGGSVGVGLKPGLGSASIGGNVGYSKQGGKWAAMQSGLIAEDEFALAVEGKTHLQGAMLGSEQVGKTTLQTRELIQEDMSGYERGSSINFAASLKPLPGKAPKPGLEVQYSRNSARQKLKSSIGGNNQGPTNYLATQSGLKVDSDMLKLAANPVKSAKKAITDSKVIYTAAEDLTATALHAPQYGLKGTVKQLQNVLVDLGTITSLAQDEEHAQKINQATALSAAELEHTLDRQLDYQQEKAGIAEQTKASVHLYQGDDAAFGGSKAEDLHHYKGGYDTQHNKVYVNTNTTDITHGSDIQKVLFTEQQRKENNSNPFLKDLDGKQQKALAYDRGDRAAKNWERFSDASAKSDPVAVNAWNESNKDSLAKNNEWISQVDGDKVKPREYNVDREKGKISYVSERGGNKTDYFNIGHYEKLDSEVEGKFIQAKDQRQLKSKRGEGKINSFRFLKTDKSTLSRFIIPGETEDKDIRGYFLEPKGLATTEEGQNRRIPAGTYKLINHRGAIYQDVPKLFNAAVPLRRAILMHRGRHFGNTEACLLPGEDFIPQHSPLMKSKIIKDASGSLKKVSEPMLDKRGNLIKDTYMKDPAKKLEEIQAFLAHTGKDEKDIYQAQLSIFDVFEQPVVMNEAIHPWFCQDFPEHLAKVKDLLPLFQH